jgi:hypothetical protein
MKKITILLAFGILALTSCSKDEVDCAQAIKNYESELNNAGSNVQQISLIQQKYRNKYPSCRF